MRRVMIVDDEPKFSRLLNDFLATRGFQVWSVGTAEEALALLQTHQPDVLLLDLRLETSSLQGMDVLRQTKDLSPSTQTIIISACPHPDTKAEAFRLGARRYLEKPVDLRQMLDTLHEVAPPPLA